MKGLVIFLLFLSVNKLSANDTSIICNGQKNINGQKQGVWLCKQNNSILKKERYKNGLLITYTLYNKGEIIETRSKKGKIKKYEPCGCY